MKNILVVTGTRAEYGLLYWTMKEIQNDTDLNLQLVVTGNHLVPEYGLTVNQIIADGFNIDEKIDMLISSNSKSSIVKSMGIELIQMAQCFERLSPSMLLILGDRYETFIAATCAMMMNIPIAHMNGGESTEGAIDEQIRHAITKMSHIHFTGAEYYKEQVLKMGEEAWRVHNVGQAGIENIKRMSLLNRDELEQSLGINFKDKIALITYHPTTLESENIADQIEALLEALNEFDMQYIFTYPNADFGSRIIIESINSFANKRDNTHVFYNLGQKRYLSLLQFANIVIGNSSSGIIETPAFKLPVVNIGTRQKGRLRNSNIIDVDCNKIEIINAISKALCDNDFKTKLNILENLYGDGNTSKYIVKILKNTKINKELLIKRLSF